MNLAQRAAQSVARRLLELAPADSEILDDDVQDDLAAPTIQDAEVPVRRKTIVLPSTYDDVHGRGEFIAAVHAQWGKTTWQVESISAGVATMLDGDPSLADPDRCDIRVTKPGPSTTATSGVAVAGVVDSLPGGEDRALVEFDFAHGRVVTAALPPFDRWLRDLIALRLRVDPHSFALTSAWVVDGGVGRLDRVLITRAPVMASDQKSADFWGDVAAQQLPGGSAGWAVEQNGLARTVTLRYGVPPVLPSRVELSMLMPEAFNPEAWSKLPLGVGTDGKVVGLDLAAGPHALIVGPTGSGKTLCLLTAITAALARGHQLIIIDPIKGGLDFVGVRPWATAWAETLAEAQTVLERAYAEVDRRKAILKAHGEVKWSDLPPEVRRKDRVTPMTILIDEYVSLVLPEVISPALAKDSSYVIEAEERNSHRAIIITLVGKIAREARYVGLHLELAMQRPDAKIISGELRSNLTSVVQLVSPISGLSAEALKMAFNPEMVGVAAEEITALNDGHSFGLAVMAAEGSTVRGLRVAYTPMKAVGAILEEVGVPRVEHPWETTPPKTGRWRDRPAAPVELEPMVMEVSLDDLNEGAEGDEPMPAWAAEFEAAQAAAKEKADASPDPFAHLLHP